jgi:pilus assembly protein TadC
MVLVVVFAMVAIGAAANGRSNAGRQRMMRERPTKARIRRQAVVLLAATALLGAVSAPLALLPWLGRAASRAVNQRKARRRLRQQLILGLPETVDLGRIVVGSGATVSETVEVLAARAPPPFAEAFRAVVMEVSRGVRLVDALPTAANHAGEPTRGLVRALQAGERDGVSVAPLLERVRVEALRVRRHELEVAARRLPVLLLFPLVLCVLPAFILLTVVPLLASALQDLQV